MADCIAAYGGRARRRAACAWLQKQKEHTVFHAQTQQTAERFTTVNIVLRDAAGAVPFISQRPWYSAVLSRKRSRIEEES